MILARSTDSVTVVSMLRELHMAACLRHVQVDLWDKSVKMSCPFCTYAGPNDLSHLNHIIIMRYNGSYGCGKCLEQAFVSSSALHNHKKVCLGFTKNPLQVPTASPAAAVEATAAKKAVLPFLRSRRTWLTRVIGHHHLQHHSIFLHWGLSDPFPDIRQCIGQPLHGKSRGAIQWHVFPLLIWGIHLSRVLTPVRVHHRCTTAKNSNL